VTGELRKLSYHINEKKVYRLMDEQNLLLGKVIRTSGKRKFVQHRKIMASYPMEYLCLDIKYIYVCMQTDAITTCLPFWMYSPGKVIRTSGKRKFVQHRKIMASYPMEYLCLDIKYIYVCMQTDAITNCLPFWMYSPEER
jgi:hypothetical protein